MIELILLNWISFTPLGLPVYITRIINLSEVNYMDLFWSGLAQRASEHTRIERKSQFSGVHETAYKEIEAGKRFAEKCNGQR